MGGWFPFHAKTTEWIWMKFGPQISINNLHYYKRHFLPRQYDSAVQTMNSKARFRTDFYRGKEEFNNREKRQNNKMFQREVLSQLSVADNLRMNVIILCRLYGPVTNRKLLYLKQKEKN